ncbi:hypothetical protein [Nocardia alni]|uniref:hypothetical protein n=1 Tax=Nocardia alni TaxID=2815723 RepID=UPI001C24887D|nr:hypothetical protein [Nocardia alni]
MNRLIAPRIMLAAAVIAAVPLSGCSSSTHSSAPVTTTTTAAPAAPTAAATNSNDSAVKEITHAFVAFFDGKTPPDQKVGLLENGSTFAPAIAAQAKSPMGAASTASVSAVKVADPAHAAVTYSILMNGSPALPNQNGAAVDVGGQWKVAAATYCGLLKMQGGAPAGC